MAALKILAVATMAVLAQGMELTKSNFQAEVKDSGKNAFVSVFGPLFSPRVDPSTHFFAFASCPLLLGLKPVLPRAPSAAAG